MKRTYMNWSGGKDSSLCLHRALQNKNLSVEHLLTSVNQTHDRVSMHGVRRGLLEAQASSIGLSLSTIDLPEYPSMETYETAMNNKVAWLRKEGFDTALFGDIFLEDLRKYREEKLAAFGISCEFPLWLESSSSLMQEFLQAGFRAIVVCVNEQQLDKSFCGRIIDSDFVRDLPPGVDICGENGEYHSFVFDGPVFKHPVPFKKGEIVRRTYPAPVSIHTEIAAPYGFYYCDLMLP